MSIVWKLYEPHARPLARIVHGVPISWDQSIAAVKFPSSIDAVAWSPCGSFIVVVLGRPKATIEILDAVTLRRSVTLEFPLGEPRVTRCLVFSPDAHLLTWLGGTPTDFVSWDVQTGALFGNTSTERPEHSIDRLSATYSACGTMFGVLFHGDPTSTISTYNVLAGTHISSHSINGPALDEIWTHGECLRFATTESNSITTWEVGFTSPRAPTEVESLPIPDDSHDSGHFSLHPTLSRLAFTSGKTVRVWDARRSEFLLESEHDEWPIRTSFSLDGRFLACGTRGSEFYLWKESPTGYIPHRKLISNARAPKPLFSPSGESIIAFGDSAIKLWRTMDPTTSPLNISTQASQRSEKNFVVRLSPDKALAAVARMEDETITVLELRSGASRLIIDTGVKVRGVGVAGNTIVVVGDGQISTWNLPVEDQNPTPRSNVNDSVRTTPFNHPPFPTLAPRPVTSVSPDLRLAAIAEHRHAGSHLHIYDVHTGDCLASTPVGLEASPWFTPDGRKVWCVTDGGEAELWGIGEDRGSGLTNLNHLDSTIHPPGGFPWGPSHSYSVLDSRWVLSSKGKRLLWLPPHWRLDGWNRMWDGQFLTLSDREFLEPVILELEA